MLSNYWKNKQEEKGGLEELQNLYKDEVMKYKLSKAAGEHYYSTMFKPITEKLEETIEPLKEIAGDERRLLPLPIPAAIEYKKEPEKFSSIPSEEFKDAIEPPEEYSFVPADERGPPPKQLERSIHDEVEDYLGFMTLRMLMMKVLNGDLDQMKMLVGKH